MGTIATAFNTAFRDYVVDGNAGSGANPPSKSECRSVGTTIETWLANPVSDNYGAATVVKARRANGTSGSPTAVLSGETIANWRAAGYYVTGGPAFDSYGVEMRAEATENYTSTAQGSRWVWQVTPNTTATPADAMFLDQDYSLLVRGGLGYKDNSYGTGGTVTQATSITTGVTLNTFSGTITTVSQTVAAGSEADFTVTNSKVGANDTVVVAIKTHTSAGTFMASVAAVAAGSFVIRLTNLSSGTAGNNTLAINFAVIKGAIT
jgi:hypothetical protein